MSQEIRISGTSVSIAIPCYGGNVPLETCIAFSDLMPDLVRHGVRASILAERGNSLPTTARDNLLARFMDSDHQYLFWIDDDIIFTPSDFLQVLALATARKSAAAAYCAKQEAPLFFIRPLDEKNVTYTEDGLIECRGVGMGFSCQHRSLLQPLYDRAERYETNDKVPARAVFRANVCNGVFLGEDYHFFNDLYENGQVTYIHPYVHLKHAGRKDYDHRLLAKR